MKRTQGLRGGVGVLAALLLAAPVVFGDKSQDLAKTMSDIHEVSGEVAFVDLKQGRMTLREIEPGKTDTRTNIYELNPRDTTVTDPLDKQFLKLEDLQPGYRVTVEYVKGDDRRIAQKITVESATDIRWAVGDVASLDVGRGVFTLTHTQPGWASPVITHYRTNPDTTRVVDLQGRRFTTLADLRPGDTVQVEFTLENGERVARWIAVSAPLIQVFWATGEIESIDPVTGTLVVSQRIPSWNFSEKAYYVVDLDGTRIVDLRGGNFLRLSDLRPGDPVSVQFVDSQGRRSVQCILLVPPVN